MRWTPGGRSADLESPRATGGVRHAPRRAHRPRRSRAAGRFQPGHRPGFSFDARPTAGIQACRGHSNAPPAATSPEEEQLVEFVSFVLDDTQNTWQQLLGNRYERARLVLFRDAVESACGFAQVGDRPFYCPGDRQGLHRPRILRRSCSSASARRATSPRPTCSRTRSAITCRRCSAPNRRCASCSSGSRRSANDLSVRLELQADCYAGVWGTRRRRSATSRTGRLEEGLQRRGGHRRRPHPEDAGGRVAPESFTHGSSADRVAWFRRVSGHVHSREIDRATTFGEHGTLPTTLIFTLLPLSLHRLPFPLPCPLPFALCPSEGAGSTCTSTSATHASSCQHWRFTSCAMS